MNDGHKRQGQKHQNKSAFKIMFNPLALDTHKKVSYRGLCKRCADQIQWKVKYNKYKKMAEPAKCNYCHQKNVFRTYMRACQACSESKHVCPKCLDQETEEQTQVKLNQIEQKKQETDIERKMNQYIKTLRERSRRTVRRLLQKGTASWDNQLNTYVDQEGEALPLQFRHGYGQGSKDSQGNDEQDIDQFGNDQDSEENNDESDDQDQRQEKEKDYRDKEKQVQNKNKNLVTGLKTNLQSKVAQKQIIGQKGNKNHYVEDTDQQQANNIGVEAEEQNYNEGQDDEDSDNEEQNANQDQNTNVKNEKVLKQEIVGEEQVQQDIGDEEDWVDQQQDQEDDQ